MGTDGSVHCGIIRNPYKPGSEGTDGWAKLEIMLSRVRSTLNRLLIDAPELEAWVCEGQYTAKGRGSPDHQIRNGWVSSAAYIMAPPLTPCKIVVPSTWTRNKPKELRHPELLKGLHPQDQWKWGSKPASQTLMHNIYDAVGLAVWGLAHVAHV